MFGLIIINLTQVTLVVRQGEDVVASKLAIKVGLGSSAAVALLITSYILVYHSEVLGISPAWDVNSFQVWYQTASIKVRTLLSE